MSSLGIDTSGYSDVVGMVLDASEINSKYRHDTLSVKENRMLW